MVVLACFANSAAAFEVVEAKNFAKQDFVFPAAIQGSELQLLFLGIAKDQDNGTYQGAELIKWHKALITAGVDAQKHRFWHFPVIENPPFFVKGLIRRGIAKDYAELLPPEQGAVLFVEDIQRFAEAADVPLDGMPTVVIYSEQQGVVALYRGEVTDSAVTEIAAKFTESHPTGT
jgi:hypothetical protein